MLKSVISILAVLIFGFTSCSLQPIVKEETSEYIMINQGEKAKIRWKFANANLVKIPGEQGEFNKIDSTFVSPEFTTSYFITAFNKKNDSLVSVCKVLVNPNTERIKVKSYDESDEKFVQRGPINVKFQELGISKNYNQFLSGTIQASKFTEPKDLRILSTFYNHSDNSLTLKALLLDEYGNYLSGFTGDKLGGKWNLEASCKNVTHKPAFTYLKENKFSKDFKIDISILLDNSAAQYGGFDVLNNIREFTQYLSPDCNIMFSTFNQKYTQMFALSPIDKALWELQNLELNKPQGLNSLYKSAYLTLDLMNNGYHNDKICIIITYISDNSSIIYTANDVYNISQKIGVPVYIIGMGEAIDSYNLRALSNATGGRYYHLMRDELNKLNNVLTEIALSYKNNYELSFSLNYFRDCSDFQGKLLFEVNNSKLDDKFRIQKKPEFPGLKYQALVNFDYRDDFIHSDYHELLNSLVFVLNKNPDQSVLLIGHSSTEGTEAENLKFSISRANKVREYLMQNGVAGNRIEIRGDGYHKPIYFFQQNEWEQKYNRRVEIKWLDPTVKPFEIITEVMPSEEQASKAVDFWENKGFKAYYDRFILNNTPQYQVRIWNFGTKDEARKTANEIQKKFKKNVIVE